MTTTDDELLALARKATPGPWTVEEFNTLGPHGEEVVSSCDIVIAADGETIVADHCGKHTAAYIAAAHPAAIIALIERHRAEIAHLEHLAQYDAGMAKAADETIAHLRAEVERLTRGMQENENEWQETTAKLIKRAEAAESALAAIEEAHVIVPRGDYVDKATAFDMCVERSRRPK